MRPRQVERAQAGRLPPRAVGVGLGVLQAGVAPENGLDRFAKRPEP